MSGQVELEVEFGVLLIGTWWQPGLWTGNYSNFLCISVEEICLIGWCSGVGSSQLQVMSDRSEVGWLKGWVVQVVDEAGERDIGGWVNTYVRHPYILHHKSQDFGVRTKQGP